MTSSKAELSVAAIEQVLQSVKDPEIPVISIRDLGILQQVEIVDEIVVVTIIPTYSGCPAMFTIKEDIKTALLENDITQFEINLANEPIWNTDMITTKGSAAMLAYGIAPPLEPGMREIKCPQCGSAETTCISEFGSTACKALYRCESCLEPFDYFKCHA